MPPPTTCAGSRTTVTATWRPAAGHRQFEPDQALAIETADGETVRLQKVRRDDGQEVHLFCHSPGREQKENAINTRFITRLEAGLQKLTDGLTHPRGEKRPDRLQERIGRLKATSRGIGQHDRITLEADATGQKAVDLRWRQPPVPGTLFTDPGVYCLTSNQTGWDDVKQHGKLTREPG